MLPTMASANKAKEHALALPEDVQSFEDELGEDSKVSSDEEWQAAWKETIERRIRSIDDGTAEMIDAEDFFAEMDALVPDTHP